MARYECIHCGATAISKCVHNRTVFGDNEMEAVMSHYVKISADKVTIVLPRDANETGSQAMVDGIKQLMAYEKACDPGFKQLGCAHRWSLTSDTCDLGCCTKGEQA